MKISTQYILREIAGEFIIVPTGQEARQFQGLIAVNETGAFLWKVLQESNLSMDDLINALCETYDVDCDNAKKDVEIFIQLIDEKGMLIRE